MANPAFRHNDINTLEMPWACMQNAVIATVSSLYLHPQDNGDMTTLNGKAHQHAYSCYVYRHAERSNAHDNNPVDRVYWSEVYSACHFTSPRHHWIQHHTAGIPAGFVHVGPACKLGMCHQVVTHHPASANTWVGGLITQIIHSVH